MSTEVAELAGAIKLADPRPDRCVSCLQSAVSLGPEVRFVDFGRELETGAIVDPGSMAVLDPMRQLVICERCMAPATEQLAYKPELHARQFQKIKQQNVQIEHWKAACDRERAENDRLREYISRLESEGVTSRERPPKRRS